MALFQVKLHSNLLSLTKFKNHIPRNQTLTKTNCTISMGNKTSSNSKVHGQVTRVVSAGYDPRMGRSVSKFRDEYIAKPKAETLGTWKEHGSGVFSDNTPLRNDEAFTTFIRHAKYKIRTVSHIGREQSNVAPAPPSDDDEASGRDNQNDEFSDFIQNAKKKLRSSSSKRKNGSFKRG